MSVKDYYGFPGWIKDAVNAQYPSSISVLETDLCHVYSVTEVEALPSAIYLEQELTFLFSMSSWSVL